MSKILYILVIIALTFQVTMCSLQRIQKGANTSYLDVVKELLGNGIDSRTCIMILKDLHMPQAIINELSAKRHPLLVYRLVENGNGSYNVNGSMYYAMLRRCETFVVSPRNICKMFASIHQVQKNIIHRKTLKFIVLKLLPEYGILHDWLNCSLNRFYPYTFFLIPNAESTSCIYSDCYQLLVHTLGNNLVAEGFEELDTRITNFSGVNRAKEHRFLDLKGITVQSNMMPFGALLFVRNSSYDGVDYRIMIEFAKHLNFNLSIELSTNWQEYYSPIVNGNFQMGIRSVPLDWGIYYYVSIPHTQIEIKFLLRSPIRILFLWSAFAPFSWDAWFAVLGFVLISSFLLYSFSFLSLVVPYGHSPNPFLTYSYSLLYSISIVAGFGVLKIKFSAIRHIVIWLLMTSTILITAYSCNLVSFLTFPLFENPINTLEQFLDADMYWTTPEEVWKERLAQSVNPLLRKLSNKHIFLTDVQKMKPLAKEGKLALAANVYPSGYVDVWVSDLLEILDSDLHVMKENIWTLNFAFLFSTNSPLLDKFNIFLRQLSESGCIMYWENEIIKELKTPFKHEIVNEETLRPLVIRDIEGAFVLLIIALGVSTLVFILEGTKKIIYVLTNNCSIKRS